MTTPRLLEFGDETGRPERALPLFQGLQYLKVPSELIVYKRTGHGWEALPIREESFNRTLEWFDYWVLGKATERMTRKYGEVRQPQAQKYGQK